MRKLLFVIAAIAASAASIHAISDSDDSAEFKYPKVRIKVPYAGARTAIVPTVFRYDHLWVDTIDFGSTGGNYGNPEKVGRCKDADVRVGYDYNYLEHIVYLGDSAILRMGNLMFENVDPIKNKATFSRGNNVFTIDFNKGDALKKLEKFITAPEDWQTENLTYSLDENWNNEEQSVSISKDVRVIATFPKDKSASARLFNLIKADKDKSYECWTDTLYYTERSVNDLRGLLEYMSEVTLINSSNTVPATPNRKINPCAGTNLTIEYFPDYIKGDIVTLGITENSTYIAGGGRCSQTIYRTFDLGKNLIYGFEDIFRPEYTEQVRKAYLNGVAKDLARREIYGMDDKPYTADEVLSDLMNAYHYETADRIVDFKDVALTDKGVVFSYDFSIFSNFGEDPKYTFIIPYSNLKKYLRHGLPLE